jgi:hypothetical protein
MGAGIFGFSKGGIIPGFDTGRDTVPIMARPGEAVLPPELVQVLMNAAGGGATEIVLRADIPLLVERVNSEVRGGSVRLAASTTVTSRTRR